MGDAAEFRHNPDYSAVPPDLSYVSVGDVRTAYEQGHSVAEQQAVRRITELEDQVQMLSRKLNASETDRAELRAKNRLQFQQSIGRVAASEVSHG
jgi:hypothetical protein